MILMWLIAFALTFNLSAGNIIRENVIVETDRDIYIAGEDLFFSVFINSGQENRDPVSNICYLVLRNEKNTILKLYVKTDNKGTSSSFYLPDTLKTGYYEIVAFTNYMRNFGEEAYGRKQLIVVNRFDEWLNELRNRPPDSEKEDSSLLLTNPGEIMLITEKDTFGIRENVNLKIETKLLLSNVSITIKEYNHFSLNLFRQPNFNPTPRWNNGEVKYKPETKGIHLYGKLMNGLSPVENECLFISTPDSFPNLQYTFTNKSGEFTFSLNDYYPGKTTIIATRENYQGKYIISLDDKFALSQPFLPRKNNFNAHLRKYILESQNIVKVKKAYNINHSRKGNQHNDYHFLPHVYHEPNSVVFPSQFVVLKNFEEIVDNLLSGYRIKTKNGLSKGYHFNQAEGSYYEASGSTFLNGVYIYNLNSILSFNTRDINKIELCNTSRIKGCIQFPGIISINTPHSIDYAKILPGCLVTRQDSPLPPVSYNPPRYEHARGGEPVPDFRQTLYWLTLPEIKGNKTLSFYTSDWSASYIVELRATTPEGKRVNSISIINVIEK